MQPLTFGKYTLQERLGEGGMAVVWRAKLFGPGGFEKTLVVKQIRDELAQRKEFVDLFVAEAKLTVSLTHANIVPVFELGMVDGTYFLALELVDGPPLNEVIDEGPIPPPLAAYIVEQVLRGLDYAHRRGVVHRDLSSANVIVSRDGEVKIVDFGIAAPVDARGVQGGSRGYVAPEQEAGGAADARGDLFAVGVLLWELVSGRRYDGKALSIPSLQEIVAKATAKDPERRYPDAAAMLAAVSRFLRSMTGATTQAELGTLVRRRAPDLPRVSTDGSASDASASDHSDADAGDNDAPGTAAGPRTVPVARGDAARKSQVTFATRIGPPPPKPGAWRRRLAVAAAGSGLLALAALGGARLRDASSPTPLPTLPKTARLALHVAPAGAIVTVDGKASSAGVVELPAGRHVVLARAPGREPASREVALTAGGAADVTLTLAPARVHLVVRTEPPGAEVVAGDRSLGLTPLDLQLAIEPGARLKLKKRDFAPVERTVDVSAGAATVDARLTPLPRGELTLGALPWAHVTIDGEKRPDTPLSKVGLAAGPHQVRLVCPPTGKELRFSVQIDPGKETRKVADLRDQPHLVEE
ncbi:MAG: serine/threonine protein kinase [Myxococcales bacterium]|nr:serine/threonine protein kinase [Myxococcales bacterium]